MNRIVGNCYIIDSAGLWLTADSSSNGKFLDFDFQTASLISTNSGQLEITLESNTASDVVVRLLNSVDDATNSISWPGGFCVESRMFVKTCNVGTGFLYFK